ncbi:MAG TPA: hypothetical protein VKF32_05225 [Thermoanaerobaculia bacterium]|nr:hypothetical protein [Thermoanaerobaculia bacterium]
MTKIIRSVVCMAVLAGSRGAVASQNHVVNAHFNSSLSSWTLPPQPDFSINWTNARGHDGGGAAAVYAKGTATPGYRDIFTQCIPLVPDAFYSLGVWFRYEAGYGEVPIASLTLWEYESTDCTGPLNGWAPPPSSTDPALAGVWQLLSVDNWQNSDFMTWHSLKIALRIYVPSLHDAQGYFDDAYVYSGWKSGDADANGKVDVADVFYVINRLFAGGPAPLGPCDVNNSDSVDVNDVFYLINYLFANGPAPL